MAAPPPFPSPLPPVPPHLRQNINPVLMCKGNAELAMYPPSMNSRDEFLHVASALPMERAKDTATPASRTWVPGTCTGYLVRVPPGLP